jgi:UDP-N-acetylmuramate dehydrogenase
MDLPHHWDPPPPPAADLDLVLASTRARREIPLAPMTTLKVGGPAAGFLEVDDAEHLAVILATLAARPAVPWMVLGKGSNLLVSDRGFPGLVLRLGQGFHAVEVAGAAVHAGAAVPMPVLAQTCAQHGLAGLEFAAGVPATVGGSVRMNAGAHGGETAVHLVSATVVEAAGRREVLPAELNFSYRHSELSRSSVVVSAHWQLVPDSRDAVLARVEAVKASRRATQPIGERTCGSVFTNPPGGYAAQLIESCGLKGERHGTARISPMHANFIETDRGASASDVAALVRHARAVVRRERGVDLVPEVRLVGTF